MSRGSGSTNLGAVLGKFEVRLLAWIREVLESVPAPGVAGAILTRIAFRRRRGRYAIVLRIVAINDYSVLREQEVNLTSVGICITPTTSFLARTAVTRNVLSDVAYCSRMETRITCDWRFVTCVMQDASFRPC